LRKDCGRGWARQAIDTAGIVAEAIGAPCGLIEALDALHVPDLRLPSATPTAPRGGVSSAPSRADATPAAHPDRHDDASVIRNAAQLTADDVAMRRVLCPACEEKVFETWPGGWDAHAARLPRHHRRDRGGAKGRVPPSLRPPVP
jgi:hypothetical protein